MKDIRQGQDVLAVIHCGDRWEYYAAKEDVWVMDWKAWHEAFASRDYQVPPLQPTDRFGIITLNELSVRQFLEAIQDCVFSEANLRQMLKGQMPINNWDQVSHLFPSLLIDFSLRQLFSVYAGGLPYENFVPPNWRGTVENFFDRIPKQHHYWIDGETNFFQIALGL